MPEPTLQRVAADIRSLIRTYAPDETIPIYIARKPNSDSRLISLARGVSPGVLHGYGGLAYLITDVDVTIRDETYENLEVLLQNIVSALLLRSNYWIISFSSVQTLRGTGEKIESIEMSFTLETMEKI